ncbi:MAG: nitroreductase [Pikeienuella sp.]
MNVSEALDSRISCRAFLPDPINEAQIRRILERASRSPSGSNVQPWRVYVLANGALDDLRADVTAEMAQHPMGHPAEYNIFPNALKDKYNVRRKKCGEDMYATINVPRDDKPGRIAQFKRNFQLFGAPVGLFLYLDRQMGAPQWSDAGMFLQSLMLAAREEGLHTCAQEAWAVWYDVVARHVNPPDEEMLFCGMAIGKMDEAHPINKIRTDREAVDDFAELKGF